MSMFQHTATLYNVETYTDPITITDVIVNHITILRGVKLDATKSVNVRESGQIGADEVTLYIPFDVQSVDGATGEKKKFLSPAQFWTAEDKSNFWTLSAGKQKIGYSTGACFFIKGEAVHPEMDIEALEKLYGGNVFDISTVNTLDFGGLPHWEVGAK